MNNVNDQAYSSIFWEDDWAHQKYYGWHVLVQRRGLKVLRKKIKIFNRYLILVTTEGYSGLADLVAGEIGFGSRSDIIIHDFKSMLGGLAPRVGGGVFRVANQAERLLNVATYVIDLRREESDLWRSLGQKGRNMVRKAGQLGSVFRLDTVYLHSVDMFYRYYQPIVSVRKLKMPDRTVICQMLENGDMICTSSCTPTGEVKVVSLIYVCRDKAYLMYVAGDHSVYTGIGQFSQWNNILLLKRTGYAWYDLGGISGEQKDGGLYKFKKSIGGDYYELGVEYKCESTLIVVAKRLDALRRLQY